LRDVLLLGWGWRRANACIGRFVGLRMTFDPSSSRPIDVPALRCQFSRGERRRGV